jgi:hypothetical protein
MCKHKNCSLSVTRHLRYTHQATPVVCALMASVRVRLWQTTQICVQNWV